MRNWDEYIEKFKVVSKVIDMKVILFIRNSLIVI